MNNIVNDNEMFAQFMGYEKEKTVSGFWVYCIKGLEEKEWFFLPHELKYHKDWNWIIPVAKKCCEGEAENSFYYAIIYDALCNFDINALRRAITQYIEWSNNK